jgi:phosphoribosylglycinamide formyltransferase 1
MVRILNLALLVSGEGTTLEAVAEAIGGGHIPAKIALVVADRPHAPALEKARRRGLPTLVLPFFGSPEQKWSAELDGHLRERSVELVVLAGFLSILPARFVRDWRGRIINLHPALLPKYGGRGMYGHRVHEAVLAAKENETGATVHLVTEAVDAGPTLGQVLMPVLPNDTAETLAERLRPLEHNLLLDVLRQFSDGRLPLPAQLSDERAPRGSRGAVS